ncbi:MarR family transcriptional regulator [Brumimicrobium salinarum]|uniref:MarR family transcriptional regulator n=1 Tax=Brumimicrobium salinarum TaxID=2058658 RepID=A0A2I0R5N0_9FLAO|nr:MarR family transcriptional regulator [Brumimicrobium salinarum]PKR81680.1 MarR family transcriptional regulator [Brumimicrobium salinarum]
MKKIEEIVSPNFKNEIHKAVINIRYTSNYIGLLYNNQLNKFDLTLAQFNILRILRGSDEKLSIKTIKNRMLEVSPNTTRLIDKLIAKNCVERIRSEKDRRIVYISITEDGLAILKELDKQFEEAYFDQNLTKEEAQTLNYLLDKFRNE